MNEFKIGYIVEYRNVRAKVVAVALNTCTIQLSDHRKTVPKSELKILVDEENSDMKLLKICNRCNQTKELNEFPRLKGNTYRDMCTLCWGENLSEKKKVKKELSILAKENSELRELANRIVDIVEKKNHDYDSSFEKNVNRFGDVAALIPLSNKLDRIEKLQKEPARVKESLFDSTIDLVGYALLYALILQKRGINFAEENE